MGNYYAFLKSRSEETVPSLILPSGEFRPLHSMVDPVREAQKLVSTIPDDTLFVVFLGLGGGFAPEVLLDQTQAQALVLDFNKDGIAELLSSKDYSKLLNNERFSLLVDAGSEKIKNFIIENYKPSLAGGIKTIPLRSRTEFDTELFDTAINAIQEAIEIVSSDYSVQAHFGMRWFSNIIRNILNAENTKSSAAKNIPAAVKEAAIIAAGPSLDQQLPALKEFKLRQVFIICSDTALPVLLQNGIEPDAVVSIDCQHISYHHFLGFPPGRIPLILDIASPPLLSRLSPSPVFFLSGHPLAQYICANWQPLASLDTSGGNVTYACLSLAENLGAQKVTLFGADFSWVNSRTYAKGTYIYPYFEKKQNRFSTLEAQLSAFLYRSPFLPKERENQNYRETSSLCFYRKKLEEKAAKTAAVICAAQGNGAPLKLQNKLPHNKTKTERDFPSEEKANKTAFEFLEQYRRDIASLPAASANYPKELDAKNRHIFTTLLPTLAAIKHRNPLLKAEDLIEETKRYCMEQIDRVVFR